MVAEKDIRIALDRLGVACGDTVLFHSSLKSLGYVEGGADTVIDAFLHTVGEDGTVVVPTLVMKDFQNAYKTWNIDKPSDTGLITEVFRNRQEALRSNQATHSVAAIGRMASFITQNHGDDGKRFGIYGLTPFAVSSPWQRLFDMNASTVLLGVGMESCTFKHLFEYMFVEEMLNRAKRKGIYQQMISSIRSFETRYDDNPMLFWPYLPVDVMQVFAEENGFLNVVQCGNAKLTYFKAYDFGNAVLCDLYKNASRWFGGIELEWFNKIEKT